MNADDFNDQPLDLLEEDLIVEAAATTVISAAVAAIDYSRSHYNKIPYHDSAPTGIAWVREPTSTFPSSSPVPNSTIPTSSISVSGSKRKYSVLDDDDSVPSGSLNGSTKKRSSAAAIDGLSAAIVGVCGSMADLATERRLRRSLQQEASLAAQAAQAAEEALTSSPKRRHEAVVLLQEQEGYLKPAPMVAFLKYVARETVAANLYLSIKREDYRKSWVMMTLKDLNFVGDIANNE